MAGDTIQFLKTKEYLEKLGVEISVSHNPHEDLSPYDLIHLFNTIRVQETYSFFKNACYYNKKIFLSPIFWNYIDYIPKRQKGAMEEIYWDESDRLRREIFQGVDVILPSSIMEMREIGNRFHTNKHYEIIPNGVDPLFAKGRAEDFISQYKIKDFLLCVGRVCKHKNQLALAQVAKELDIPFVMVGPVNHLDYYHRCLRVNPDLIYMPNVDHQQLPSIYKAAKVHALVSWYEIPGLVSLEAGLAGCNIVTTQEGSTKEYFKDYADYVDPHNIQDIKEKVSQGMMREKNDALKNYISQHYLWNYVAERIFQAYQQ